MIRWIDRKVYPNLFCPPSREDSMNDLEKAAAKKLIKFFAVKLFLFTFVNQLTNRARRRAT